MSDETATKDFDACMTCLPRKVWGMVSPICSPATLPIVAGNFPSRRRQLSIVVTYGYAAAISHADEPARLLLGPCKAPLNFQGLAAPSRQSGLFFCTEPNLNCAGNSLEGVTPRLRAPLLSLPGGWPWVHGVWKRPTAAPRLPPLDFSRPGEPLPRMGHGAHRVRFRSTPARERVGSSCRRTNVTRAISTA
jgi:hypothetical protein